MFKTAKPNHRFERTLAEVRQTGTCVTDDPVEEALARLLTGHRDVPAEVVYAYSIFKDDFKREVVEAFLLAGGVADDLEEIFQIPVDVVNVYRTFFFDTEVFRDRLDAEEYARNYSTTHDEGFGQEQKCAAIDHGLEYLKAAYGRGRYYVEPAVAVRELISQAYVLSKAATRFPLDNKKAQEARQWASTMVSSIESLPKALDVADSRSGNFILDLKFHATNSDLPPLEDDISPDEIITKHVEDIP